MVRMLPTLAVLWAAISVATAFVPAPAVRHPTRYFASGGEDDAEAANPVDLAEETFFIAEEDTEAEDLAVESVLKEDKTIKSKGSGPDFTRLADEISAAFKKIFNGSK